MTTTRTYADLRREYEDTSRYAGSLRRQASLRRQRAAASAYADQHIARADRDRDEADRLTADAERLYVEMHVAAIREGYDDDAILSGRPGRSGPAEWAAATLDRVQALGLTHDEWRARRAVAQRQDAAVAETRLHRKLALSGRLGREAQRAALTAERKMT
jgi:hypothetical protein